MELISAGYFAVLALGIGLYAISVPQGGRAWWALAIGIVVLVIVSKLIGESRDSYASSGGRRTHGRGAGWSHRK